MGGYHHNFVVIAPMIMKFGIPHSGYKKVFDVTTIM